MARPASKPTRVRVVLAHDWLVGMRGGERVLDAIARVLAGLPHVEVAGLFVMFDDSHSLSRALDALPHVRSGLGRLPWASTRLRRWLLPLYPAAVRDLSGRLAALHRVKPIDLVISTSSAAIKGLKAPAGVPHLCYCHSPARYVWSQTRQYSEGSALRGLGLNLFVERFRHWDARTSANVSTFVANSNYTRSEIQRCYSRDAKVLFPPVRTEFFTPPTQQRPLDGPWLVAAALEPYKRTELAIEAAKRANRELLVVGDGSERRKLERLAGPHTRFLGRLGDERLRELFRSASVLLFPQLEDFGILAVEAQACGMPVVARRAGGALDTVVDGVTGAFFDDVDDPDAIIAAARRCPKNCDAACRENAMRFSEAAFKDGLMHLLLTECAKLGV
ncbi:MAG: glycosyltransferase [Phycisphaerales bacterium]|jgi:glycosyltransferase involved in cell wall biosynthesis